MNTYERHRQYRLRKRRARIIRRRALSVIAASAAVLALWTLLSYITPEAYAPPDPATVGAGAAKTIASTAARSVNTVHATLQPDYRDAAKRAVLALFDTAASTPAPTNPRLPTISIQLPSLDSLLPDDTSVLAQAEPSPPAPRRILDILFIGLDSRLGKGSGRADALQLLTVDFDIPNVLITSIPRGTYSDIGYKNEASNIIANVRSARGRKELLKRVARICRRDSVPYYVEVGFSDALGVLDLLGYNDPAAELQALRQRRSYQYGDHNRCYNQGLFVRDAILRLLPLLEGVTGDVLLRAGRDLVTTNLSHEHCRGIAYLLNDGGVSNAPDLISVTIKSRFRDRIVRDAVPPSLTHAVRGIDYSGMGGKTMIAERRIRKALSRAEADSASPKRVHERLWTMFQQHGWMQISDRTTRRVLRDSLASLLELACSDLGRTSDLSVISRTVKADEILFHSTRLQTDNEGGSP